VRHLIKQILLAKGFTYGRDAHPIVLTTVSACPMVHWV
jgi:hypothetical protein